MHAASELTGARVLVVEDEFLISLEVQADLAEAGAQVVGPSATIEGALDLVRQETLSAAIVDFRLGRDTIVPILRELSARAVPFVLYTGLGETGSIRKEWPRCKIVTKPASPAVLIGAVSDLLQR